MSKPSKRPQREDRAIHAAIREAAATLAAAPRLGLRDAAEFPEVLLLLNACRDAVAGGVPRSVPFRGRSYWLQVRLVVDLDIFDSPTAREPLLQAASFSAEAHGHRPGH